MSDRDHISDTRECGVDVAAYALGALEPAEAEAFRRHLESCAVCRDELAAFEGVVNLLPMSAPVHPVPADLRRRVMRAVESDAAPSSGRARSSGRRLRLGDWFVPRPALAMGAAVMLAAVVFVGLQLSSPSSSSARVIHAEVAGQGTADLRLTSGHGELVLHHFSPPPAGQIYEVWVMRARHPPSPTSALFSVTAKGDGDVTVPGSLRGVSKVMVTPEPAGGTRVPTHPPVIQASLT